MKIIKNILNINEENLEKEIIKYYTDLSIKDKKKNIFNIQNLLKNSNNEKPLIFRILDLPIIDNQKNHILNRYSTLINSIHPDNKLKTWLDSLLLIPFGKYKGIDLNSIDNNKTFLNNLENIMNESIYGHNEAKNK